MLAAEAGRVEQAGELRRRKTEMDRARIATPISTIRITSPTMRTELARLAETLGRRFEAIGFLTWMTRRRPRRPRRPDSPGPHCTAAKRRPARRGSTLAQLLASEPRRGEADRPPATAEPVDPAAPQFRDDAQAAGLSFVYENGESSLHQLPEFAGGGVGLIDYDGDGWLDVYLVQGGRFPPIPPSPLGATACSATAATGRSRT